MTTPLVPLINQIALSGEVQSVRRHKFEIVVTVRYVPVINTGEVAVCEIDAIGPRNIEELEVGKIKPHQIVFITGRLVSQSLSAHHRQHRILMRHLTICRQPQAG